MLLNRSLERDSISTARYKEEIAETQRESANLLYVAMTRARNMLVISGCRSSKRSSERSWYEQLVTALGDDDTENTGLARSHGKPEPLSKKKSGRVRAPDVDPRLGKTLSIQPALSEIAPSRSTDSSDFQPGDADGILRGLVIHRLLQLAIEENPPQPDFTMLLHRVANEYHISPHDAKLLEWWQETRTVLDNSSLDWLTRPDRDHRAFSEIPIEYRRRNQTVYGVIDRIVAGPQRVTLVDYKTHRSDDTDIDQLVSHYRPQLELYREGVQRLWPEHAVRTCLLLTDGCHLVDVT
jgi:ATP-dependent helicase/nuclease subunit A